MLLQILLYILACIFIWKVMNTTYLAFTFRLAVIFMVVLTMRAYVLH